MSAHERLLNTPVHGDLVKKQHEDASDEVHDDAGLRREYAVQDEEGTAEGCAT